jgi:hypothetical protein
VHPIRFAIVVALLAPLPAVATPPDEAADETWVAARDVMPRVAYRALEPHANPVRVEATVFPGRVFHGAIGDVVGRLAGDQELDESAALVPSGQVPPAEPGAPRSMAPIAGLGGAGSDMGRRPGGASIGGAVLRATSGLGVRVGQAVQRVTGHGDR